jgi:large subunit ribosomal protein L30
LAAVRIRSAVDSTTEIRDTLAMLHLRAKNACVIVPDTPGMRGMLIRAAPYITWGEVSDGTVGKLKRRMIKENVFALHPPRGGFERKGIKVPFKVGGAMGYRGEMDALLERMS